MFKSLNKFLKISRMYKCVVTYNFKKNKRTELDSIDKRLFINYCFYSIISKFI